MSEDLGRLVASLNVLNLTFSLFDYVHSGCCQRYCSTFPCIWINTAFIKAGHVRRLHCWWLKRLYHGLIRLSEWRRLLSTSFKTWSFCCFALMSCLSHDLFRLLCHSTREQHCFLCWNKLSACSDPGWSIITMIIWPEKQFLRVDWAILKLLFIYCWRIFWWVHFHLSN